MIIAFEKEHNVTVMCNGQVSKHYPLAYPNEPKAVLFTIVGDND